MKKSHVREKLLQLLQQHELDPMTAQEEEAEIGLVLDLFQARERQEHERRSGTHGIDHFYNHQEKEAATRSRLQRALLRCAPFLLKAWAERD